MPQLSYAQAIVLTASVATAVALGLSTLDKPKAEPVVPIEKVEPVTEGALLEMNNLRSFVFAPVTPM